MKASLNWIRELLPELSADASAVERRFTAAGLEVEFVGFRGQHEIPPPALQGLAAFFGQVL